MQEILLDIGDGPEGIKIYADDERGVVDWAQSFPALYIDVAINGAFVHLGPFTLGSIYTSLKEATSSPTRTQTTHPGSGAEPR